MSFTRRAGRSLGISLQTPGEAVTAPIISGEPPLTLSGLMERTPIYYDNDGFFTKVGKIGVGLGLEWGGNWKSIPDKPHFQLPDWGSTTAGIKKLYATPEAFMKTWIPDQEPEGWVHDAAGWWYRNADGTWPSMCWKLINHHWYLFGASGYMLTGWVQWDGEKTGAGDWYYLEESGEFQGACWHENAKGKGGMERWYVE